MVDKEIHTASLAGRCTSGQELGQGTRNHAVNGVVNEAWGELHGVALCGAKPGKRSVGWSLRDDEEVSCPKCLKKKDNSISAMPSKSYFGKIVESPKTDLVIQHIGRGFHVEHSSRDLEREVSVGEMVTITYNEHKNGRVIAREEISQDASLER